MIDCHCHIHSQNPIIFNLNEEETIESIQNIKLQYPNNKYTYGIHPWNVGNEIKCEEYIERLKTLLQTNQIVAIGECGLDTKLTTNDISIQKQWFERQLQLSKEYSLPVYIHTVNTMNEIILMKKKWKESQWIIHGFNSSLQQAKQLMDLNCYLSIGRIVLNKNNAKITPILKLCYERKRLLIETDNDGSHVADIKEIYENIAERLEIDVNDLIKEINDCLKSLNMI